MYFPAMYVIGKSQHFGWCLCIPLTEQFTPDEWFIARKGFAFAVIWAGTGVGGAIFPFISQWLLDSYGFRTALRVWAIVIVGEPQCSFGIALTDPIAGDPCLPVNPCHEEPPPSLEL